MAEKIHLFPCTGLTKVIGTITRDAGYIVAEDLRPEVTILGCAPPLITLPETIDYVKKTPVLALEG